MLIADDAGLGKSAESGLVLCELLLRRRVDYVVVSSRVAMTSQWQDELGRKLELRFTIIDRDYPAAIRWNSIVSASDSAA